MDDSIDELGELRLPRDLGSELRLLAGGRRTKGKDVKWDDDEKKQKFGAPIKETSSEKDTPGVAGK